MQQAEAMATAPTRPAGSRKAEKFTFEQVMSSPVAKQVGRELVRGVLVCCLAQLQGEQ